jgi:hypothetical protein
VFVALNYLYADFLILIYRPGAYESVVKRMSVTVTVAATLVMELLLSMALLSRILAYPWNRRINLLAGIVGTLFVAVTLNARAPLAYWILSSIEMASTLFIVGYAWTWRPEALPRGER